MSKELEYIQRQKDIVKQQVKGSKMKIIFTDPITKHQYDYYENELQTLESIEKALLKAQEPKHYLKWEDLEFTNEVKEMKVKLGDNTYEIEYYICNALGLHQPVVILKTSDFIAITIEQFFNDLHLERVE